SQPLLATRPRSRLSRSVSVDPQRKGSECGMIVILGLVILVAAVIVGVGGVLGNGGSGHALSHGFALFGYHVTGSTGTLFLYGIVAGAVALFGLSLRRDDAADGDTHADSEVSPVVGSAADPADAPVVGSAADPADAPVVGSAADPADAPVVGSAADPGGAPVVG